MNRFFVLSVEVAGRQADGTPTISTILLWDQNNNTFRSQTLEVPINTDIVRLTFVSDQGSPDCNEDRNAWIDYLTFDGRLIQGENFNDTGGLPGPYAGCDAMTPPAACYPDGPMVAGCGNNYDWVEYAVPHPVPAIDDLSMVALAVLLLVSGIFVFARTRDRSVAVE